MVDNLPIIIVGGELNGQIQYNSLGSLAGYSLATLTGLLSAYSGTAQGLVPVNGSSRGATYYLDATGNWSIPAGGGGGVTSFNTRTGAVTLTGSDVTGAGGALLSGATFTGAVAISMGGSGTGFTVSNAAAITGALNVGGGGTFGGTLGLTLTSGTALTSDAAIAVVYGGGGGSSSGLGLTVSNGATFGGAVGMSATGLALTINNYLEVQGGIYLSSSGSAGPALLGTSTDLLAYINSTELFDATSSAVTFHVVPNTTTGIGYYVNNTPGASCGPGSPTSSFQSIGGIVTHC